MRDLTEDFCALIAQIDRSYAYEQPPILPAGENRREVAKFGSIKNAAENLYEALGAACTKHTEHQVHFSLQPSYISSTPEVRFHIGFRQLLVRCVGGDMGPIWLTIESRVSESLISVSTPPPVCESLQPDTALPNLCLHRNFCNQLSQLLSRSLSDQNQCIGLLEDLSNRTHYVYLNSRGQFSTKTKSPSPSSSLKDVLDMARHSNVPFNSIPQLERIQLAKRLATALLSFHETSWLSSTWCSENVFLYGVSGNIPQHPFKLDDPYVNVAVRGPCSPTFQTSDLSFQSFASNPFLFRLGVMLLEIELETPLRSLQQPVDVVANHDHRHTEFFTAKRVSRISSRPLGNRYHKIVMKCLNCDFGRGDDLNDMALQEAVYRDVIHELGRLEEKLHQFNLDV